MSRCAPVLPSLLLLMATACAPAAGGGDPDGGTDAGADAGEDGGTDAGTPSVSRAVATIGPEGGVIELDGATLLLQAGSLGQDTEIVFEHDPEAGEAEALSGTWSVGPQDLVLASSAELRLPLPSQADDPALFWNRHPDFGAGLDRLEAWVEDGTLVGRIQYLGAGHVAPARDTGIVTYFTSSEIRDGRDGPTVVWEPPRTNYVWRALGGGGTSSGTVATSPYGLYRAGPLHPGAVQWTRCLPGPSFCGTEELGMRTSVSFAKSLGAPESTALLELQADNLLGVDRMSAYRFASEEAENGIWLNGAALLDNGFATAGDTQVTLPFSPPYSVDPATGDRGWLFEYAFRDAAPVPYYWLAGFASLDDLAVPPSGTVSASASVVPVPADDTFVLQLDTADWAARLPQVTTLQLLVYGTWGRWAPLDARGAPLAIAYARPTDLGTPVEIPLPQSPIPEWEEHVLLVAGPTFWRLRRDDVDGRILPAPPILPPTGLTFDGVPGDPSAYVSVDARDGVVVEWEAPEADVPLFHWLSCRMVDGYDRQTLAISISRTPRAVIEPEMFGPLASYVYGYCYLSTEEAKPVFGEPPRRVLSNGQWWYFQTW